MPWRIQPRGRHVGITARRMAPRGATGGAGRSHRPRSRPGVPEKDLGLMFEPFYRVDAARGHGRALRARAWASERARAVALHGGGIEARQPRGRGLSVTITLPAMSRAAHSGGVPRQRTVGRRLTPASRGEEPDVRRPRGARIEVKGKSPSTRRSRLSSARDGCNRRKRE